MSNQMSPAELMASKLYDDFFCAVRNNKQNIVELAVAGGWNVNEKNNFGELPLELAIQQGNLEMTKVLLRAGASTDNTCYSKSVGPLHIAAKRCYLDIVEELIKVGADVNAYDDDGLTPLHLATSYWAVGGKRMDISHKIIKVLIEAGANVNEETFDGETPLYFSINDESGEEFELLLSLGAKINTEYTNETFLLRRAVDLDHAHVMQRLVELGADVNTCLHYAVQHKRCDMVKFLLNNGAAINALNACDRDPLCHGLTVWFDEFEDDEPDWYEREDMLDCFNLLVQRGADLNRVNKDNLSCLYISLSNYKCGLSSEFVRILLKNGANFDFEHPSVLEVMNKSNESPLAHLLVRHAALFEAQNRSDAPLNFNVNKLNGDLKRDYARCRDELQWMRDKKIRYTGIPFFKILAAQDIGLYTENKHVQKVFKTKFVSDNFPMYHDLMGERFKEKFEYQKLVRRAVTSLSRLLNWNENSMKVILDLIVAYLNEKDLATLAAM